MFSPPWKKILSLCAAISMAGFWSACFRQTSPEGAMTTAPVQVSNDPGQENQRGGDYSLGVPVCDEFFKKYEKCILEKTPVAERHSLRFAYEKTIEQIHLQFKEDKNSVLSICPKLQEGTRLAMSVYRCEW